MAPSNNATLNDNAIFNTRGSVFVRQTSNNSTASFAPFPAKKWTVVLAIASVIAIGVSSYLGYVGLTSSKIAGCGNGTLFNCGHVTTSRWSMWMGIPVSLLAVGLYVGLLGSLLVGSSSRFSNSFRRAGWGMTSVFAIAAGLAAIWFVSLQVFVLNHLCTYCLVAHACGLVIASVIVWQKPSGATSMKAISAASLSGVAVLVGGQLVTEAPKTYQIEQFEASASNESDAFEFEAPFAPPATIQAVPEVSINLPTPSQMKQGIAAMMSPASILTSLVASTPLQTMQETQVTPKPKTQETKPAVARKVAVNGGTVQLDVSQWPIAGSTSAKYIFVEMFDYSCPHCRHTHAAIKKAKETLKGDLAVVVLPVPLNSACNPTIQITSPSFTESCEISKLAVALWRVEPAKFTEFHNWMFDAETAPTYALAKQKADSLTDATKLDQEIASGIPAQYLAKTVELYKRAGKGNVPKLMFPTTSIVGEFTSPDGLVDIIKQQIK